MPLVLWNDFISGGPTPGQPNPSIDFTNSWARQRYEGIEFNDSIRAPGQNQYINENFLYQVDTGDRCFSDDVNPSTLNLANYPCSPYTPNWLGRQPLMNPNLNLNQLYATVRVRAANPGLPVVASFNLVFDARTRFQNAGYRAGNYRDSFLSFSGASPPQIIAQYAPKRIARGCAYRLCVVHAFSSYANQYPDPLRLPLPEPPFTQSVPRGFPIRENNITIGELFGNGGREQGFGDSRIADCTRCAHLFQVFRQMQGMIVYRFNPVASSNCVLEYTHVW